MGFGLALLGALPALLAMWYFDRLDARRPEPPSTLRRVAVAGAVSVLPCAVIEVMLMSAGPPDGTYQGALFKGFVVAGAVEELAKLLCVRWFVWHKPEFDERFDGIVYATRAGLGFALLENVFYLLQTKDAAGFVALFLLRALLAVPGHAVWAGIMGYCAAIRRYDHRGPGLVGGYLIAVFLHGAYDAAFFVAPRVQVDAPWAVAPVFAVPLAIIFFGVRGIRRLSRLALAADDMTHAASRAGTEL